MEPFYGKAKYTQFYNTYVKIISTNITFTFKNTQKKIVNIKYFH